MAFVTAEEVLDITGVSVSNKDIARAQAIIEIAAGRVEDDDISAHNLAWLKKATAFQAAYDDQFARSERSRPDIQSISQGDLSFSYDGEADVDVAPLAKRALRRLSWMGTRSVPTRSLHSLTGEDECW